MPRLHWAGVMLVALAAAMADVRADVVRLSEPVEVTADTEVFAAAPVTLPDVEPLSLATLLADAPSHLDREVVVQTRVAQVCQKKGCFFIAQEGSVSVRVSFTDYAFFVPTDSTGKTVTLVGRLVAREVSEAQAAHFRKDLGDPASAVTAGRSYELVASAVSIPR